MKIKEFRADFEFVSNSKIVRLLFVFADCRQKNCGRMFVGEWNHPEKVLMKFMSNRRISLGR